MIYQSQFSDYNDELYSVQLETPPTGQESHWVNILDDTIYLGHQNNWLSYTDNSDYSGTSYGMQDYGFYIWRNPTISMTLPDGQYWFCIAPDEFNGIEVGDVIEIRFTFCGRQSQVRNGNSIQHTYGIQFGHLFATNSDGVTTYTMDDGAIDLLTFNDDNGEEYSFEWQVNGNSLGSTYHFDYFGFMVRNTNCNWFGVRNMTIYNKSRGTSFLVQDATHQWQLGNYYPVLPALGNLHTDIPENAENQAGQMVWVNRQVNQDNGYFGSGYYFEAWTNSDDYSYTFNLCEYQENKQFRFPNFYASKSVSLRPGQYKIQTTYWQKQGIGGKVYLMRNGEIIDSHSLAKAGDTTTDTWNVTTNSDVDEIRIGNFEQGSYSQDFLLNRVIVDNFEITQTYTDVTLGGTPFVVELSGDDEDLFKPIRSSIATISIVSDQYLFDLYSNQNNIHVKLIKGDWGNGSIEWVGLVKPLVFDMGYNQELEEIEIECQDYITSLESIYLTDIDILTNHPIMTFGELFNKILFENTKYKYLLVPNLTNFDMLSTYKISTRNFIDDDCKLVTQNSDTQVLYADKNWSLYKILEEMCKYMGVTLVTEGEDVILIPYLQLQFTYTYKWYQIGVDLSVVATAITKKHEKSVTDLYDNSSLNLLPVLNKFSVKTKTNKVKEILPDFLNDDNVENITNVPVGQQTTWETSIDLGEFEFEDDKKYQCDVKMLRTKSDKCKNYTYTQNPKPTTVTYDPSIIHQSNVYPVRYSGLIDNYGGGIIDFRSIEVKEESEESNLKSKSMTSYDRYLVLAKGKDDNINLLPTYLPCFKIVSDEMQFTNKMALQFSGSMVQTPYVKASNGVDVEDVFDQVPIDRDEDMHISFEAIAPGVSNAYHQTEMFGFVTMDIKVGDYYFHNSRYDKNFLREGFWNTTPDSGGINSTRLQFDNEQNEWAFGKTMSEVDNSGDSAINQDSSGYWVMFKANEDNLGTSLPEKFTGRLEITFYPNWTQSINDDHRYFGSDIQFLKDFKVKLVVPRNMEYTEDEWNSETQIDAVVDSESLQKAETIEVEMHTDFGKCPSYSVVMGAQDYQVININESGHCAEEWIVYNYTKEYSEIRKVLETSVKGDIYPYSLITMTDRNHFGKMVVDSYKKDYRTGLTKVKLVELCDLSND